MKAMQNITIILCAAAALFILAMGPAAAEDENSYIYGYVLDNETHDGIENAQVHIWDDNDTSYFIDTNSEGYYDVYVYPGSYHVEIKHERYYTHEGELTAEDEGDQEYTAYLDPLSLLSGNITEASTALDEGDPVRHVGISVWNENESYWGDAGEDGHFEIWVADGDYSISYYKRGFQYHSEPVTVSGDTRHDSEMIRDDAYSRVYGYITEAGTALDEGDPVRGADVDVENGSDDDHYESDSDGYYELFLYNDTYDFYISADGYLDHAENIDVSGDVIRDVELERDPSKAKFYGYITDKETTGPVENADVSLDWYSYYARTDENGYYEMFVDKGDEHDLEVTHDDYRRYFEEDLMIAGDMRKDVQLEPKGEPARVFGVVADKDTGEPVEGVEVGVYNDEYDEYHSTTTDEDGEYSIDLENEGDFSHWVDETDEYKGYHGMFTVSEGEEKEINISLEKKPKKDSTIKGYVRERGAGALEDDPVADAGVDLRDDMGDWDNTDHNDTDEDGYYEFQVAAGIYEVSVDEEGYYFAHEYVVIGAEEEIWRNITLDAFPDFAGTVSGTITDVETGEPVEGAFVTIDVDPYNTGSDDETDGSGHYEIELRPGHYTLDVWHDDHFEIEDIYFEITVGALSDVVLDFQMRPVPEPTATIKGFVTDADTGEALEDMELYLSLEDTGWENDTETNESGYYEFLCPPGNLQMMYYGNGGYDGPGALEDDGPEYRDYEKGLYIYDGETFWYNFSLESIASAVEDSMIHGHVYDNESGDPIPFAYVMVQNFLDEHENGTQADGDGYYEMMVYDGNWTMMAMAREGYYFGKASVSVGQGALEEITQDFHLDPRQHRDSRIKGTVTDEQGDPVVGIMVTLIDITHGDMWDNTDDVTDINGFYDLWCPTNATFLVMFNMEDEGSFYGTASKYVEVYEGSMAEVTVDITLPDARPSSEKLELFFGGWDTITGSNRMGGDENIQQIRFMLDMWLGNGDGMVSEEELQMFMEANMDMTDMDDTRGDFHVDDIYYVFDDFNQMFLNLTGPVDSNRPVEMAMYFNATPERQIPDAGEHTIRFKVEPNSKLRSSEYLMYLPGGWKLKSHDAPPSYTVEGVGTGHIRMVPGAGYYEEEVTFVVERDATAEYGVNLSGNDSAEGETGHTISFYLEVENTGNVLDTYNLDVSGGTRADHADWVSMPGMVTVDAGASKIVEVTIGIPGDAASDTPTDYYFVFMATSRGDPQENASHTLTLTVFHIARGLEMNIPEDEKSVLAGSQVSFQVYLRNTGEVEDCFDLGIEDAGGHDDWLALPDECISLGAGESNLVTVTVLPPNGTSDDIYGFVLNAVSRGDSSVKETATFNVTVESTRNYGVELTTPVSEKQAMKGERVIYLITVKNTGNGEDTFNITVTETVAGWATPELTEVTLGAGASMEFDLTVDVPLETPVTTAEITVAAESQGDPAAGDELNITVTVLEDTATYGVELRGDTRKTVTAGEQASYELTVTNTGNGEDTMTIEVTGVNQGWATLEITSVTLAPGASRVFNLTVIVPGETPKGAYHFTISATSQGNGTTTDSLEVTVTVEKEGDDDSPGFGAVVVAIALVSVVLVSALRRRRE